MTIQSIIHRFKVTNPNPTKKDQATQVSLHFSQQPRPKGRGLQKPS